MTQNILDRLELGKAINLAKKKAQEKSYEEVVDICSDILIKFPNNKKTKDLLNELPPEYFLNKGNIHLDKGELEAAINHYRRALKIKPDSAEAHNNIGFAQEKRGEASEAITHYKQALRINPKFLNTHMNLGIILMGIGSLEESEGCFKKVLTIDPSSADAKINLGNIYLKRGDVELAIDNYTQALELNPNNINAHYNMGIAEQKKNNFQDSIKWYKKTIELNPTYLGAYTNMGIIFTEMNDSSSAIESFSKALEIQPFYAEGYNNLGLAFAENEPVKATECFKKAIQIKPDFTNANINLGVVIKNISFTKYDLEMAEVLSNLIKKRIFLTPSSASKTHKDLLKLNPEFSEILSKNRSGNVEVELHQELEKLVNIPLFIELMMLCPMPDLEIESLILNIRRAALLQITEIKSTQEISQLFAAIACQCFINEYIYNEKANETEALVHLEEKIIKNLEDGTQPSSKEILILASYKSLNEFSWIDSLLNSSELTDVIKMQILDKREEKILSKSVPVFNQINNETSAKVRDQYESNPYPRWISVAAAHTPISIEKYIKKTNLKIYDQTIIECRYPEILIAGCGTGQHSIETTLEFEHKNVLAIDLSLSSLSYAKRKTKEYDLKNTEYMQADILDLEKLGQKFDIIESAGTLHHMKNPMAGWKILTQRLKPGGIMLIGLYSELARKNIVKVREEIEQLGINPNSAEMISFREGLIKSDQAHHKQITQMPDFYSLSELRDLLFHVEEHRFTIPQIKEHLNELGLVFCGFPHGEIQQKFKSKIIEPEAIYDLDKWDEYERKNPDVFFGMYQFWCQKPY